MSSRRVTAVERRLLELVADETVTVRGTLGEWRGLRALLGRLGAPCGEDLCGEVLRQVAGEVLVNLGIREREDGPLVTISPAVFRRAWPARTSRWKKA